jgi:transposase-like protein
MTVTGLDRPAGITDPGQVAGDDGRRRPPAGPARARRRTFTAQYKQEILAAYDAAPGGEKGAILRREGLYSSLISEWRRARDAGALAGLRQPRGRPAADPRDARIARLERDKAKLEKELATSRFVVEVQAKLQALLERLSEGADNEPGPTS